MRSCVGAAAIALAAIACASAPTAREGAKLEARILSAAIDAFSSDIALEASHPFVLLDHTDTWIPAQPVFDEDYPPQLIPGVPFHLLPHLRAINQVSAPLPLGLRTGSFRFFSSSSFNRAYESEQALARLGQALGGLPIVLSFSRPYIDNEHGQAIVAVHSLSSWSGCGSVSLYGLQFRQDTWVVTHKYLHTFW
jgi:hypothetical protein